MGLSMQFTLYEARNSSPQMEEKTIYVRGLSSDTKRDDITEVFEKFGALKDVYVPLDYYSRKPKNFAYVKYLIIHADSKIQNMPKKQWKSLKRLKFMGSKLQWNGQREDERIREI
jgi:FUS-interacting serine-arginine-rich protein 1